MDISEPAADEEVTRLASFAAKCKLQSSDGDKGQAAAADLDLLTELVEALAGLGSEQTAALHSAGITARELIAASKPDLDALAKRAGLSLGTRMRLKGAVGKVVAAAGPGGGQDQDDS